MMKAFIWAVANRSQGMPCCRRHGDVTEEYAGDGIDKRGNRVCLAGTAYVSETRRD